MTRQEIYCHECQRYVQFTLDTEQEGNHVLHCPNCGHEHCRVVKGGRITGDRWDSRNGATWVISVSTISTSVTSFTSDYYSTTGNGDYFLTDLWGTAAGTNIYF